MAYSFTLPRPLVLGQVRRRYHHFLIDECQDMSRRQLQLVLLLAPPGASNGPYAVGDAQQAIYGFRGSMRRVFDDLRERVGN